MKKHRIEACKRRAKELLAQMTPEEKIMQMCNAAPAIERLGIESYNWWNEALHGVARAGIATVFPVAIGLAASFNAPLVKRVGDCVSTEGRAKHNAFRSSGDRGIYKGLTFWSPNINIFRDPRWGRGHETYGEDPHLTATMGVNYVNGLQGDDDNYLKSAACAKHYIVHSGPEYGRHSFDSRVDDKDFYETYAPAFERCVRDARVEGVMGAYNRVNGEACCASIKLISEILRDKWGFDGYYVSDCDAIHDIYAGHRLTDDIVSASVMAVRSGCDLNCGMAYTSLIAALGEGLITQAEIDECVLRLLTTKLKLGLIDGEDCPYNSIGYSQNDTESAHELSLQASEQSIVMLKNDGVLPLDVNKVKSIAVIGPNANTVDVLLGNYNGTPSEYFTVLEGIRAVFGKTARINYAQACLVTGDRIEGSAGDRDGFTEALLAAKESDVAIVCVGLTPRLEGEEGDAYNSDIGGDKRDLELPGLQNELIEKIIATGTKVVVVNIAGSAVNLTVSSKANAVLQAWYPGMYGGKAIANVLAGKCNPSAKLPVTFYRSSDDLPDITEYSMAGRTYRYFKGDVVYPFGYGLSYTTFEYSNPSVERCEEGATITVTVKNTGDMDGREVVQVYARNTLKGEVLPRHQLVAFTSVEIPAGQERVVTLSAEGYWLCSVNSAGERVLPDECTLFVGGSQPDELSGELCGTRPLELKLI